MTLKHVYFIVLILILIVGTLTFVQSAGDKSMQMLIGMATAVSYSIWGVLYHVFEGDFYPKIFVEYLLVMGIAIIILATVLWV